MLSLICLLWAGLGLTVGNTSFAALEIAFWSVVRDVAALVEELFSLLRFLYTSSLYLDISCSLFFKWEKSVLLGFFVCFLLILVLKVHSIAPWSYSLPHRLIDMPHLTRQFVIEVAQRDDIRT